MAAYPKDSFPRSWFNAFKHTILKTKEPSMTTHHQVPHRSNTHKERFYHFIAERGHLIGNQNVVKPGKAITVFVRQEDDPQQWFATAASCHPNDNFCRKTGRTIARRKYFLQKNIYFIGATAPTYEDIARTFT